MKKTENCCARIDMAELPCQKQERKDQNKERQHVCHLPEQSVADIVHCHSKASGRIHHNRKEQKQSDSDQSDAPYNIIVSFIAVASAFHLIEHFLFCRISGI